MRRVSALVIRQRFHALHPSGEVGKSLREREEARNLNDAAASLDAARKSSWTNGNTTMSAAEILSLTSHCELAKRSPIILSS